MQNAPRPTGAATTETDHPSQPPRLPAPTRADILVVDDDQELRHLTGLVLSTCGYAVQQCGSAEEALLHLGSCAAPRLLLSDIQMPGRSGVELAQALQLAHPTLPVLLVSGAPLPARAATDLRPHSWAFLPKPFLIPDLLAQINDLLSRSAPDCLREARALDHLTRS